MITRLMVMYSDLNLREGPGLQHEIIGYLKRGDVVAAEAITPDKRWYRLAPPWRGWASAKYLHQLDQPALPWMEMAKTYLGVAELPGGADNPIIQGVLRSTTLPREDADNDETPWCSAFHNKVYEDCGIAGTDSAWAKSWLNWGRKIERPRYGCTVVFTRDGGGHVAWYVNSECQPGYINVLGGNQSDRVSIAPYRLDRVIGYRMVPSYA